MNTTDANPVAVDSSAAAPEVEQSIPSAGPERIEWQKTGKITPKAAPAPASDASSKEKVESAAASEAAPQEKAPKRDTAESRLAEILADLKTAGLSPAQLKTFKREAAAQTQAEPSPAKQPEQKPVQKLEPPKEPDISAAEYQGEDGWNKYEKAVRQFNKDNAKYEAAVALENYKQDQVRQAQAAKIGQEFDAAVKKYPDFQEKAAPLMTALLTDKAISPFVAEVIGNSPLLTDVVYTLGRNMDDFINLAKRDPVMALKKVAVVEHLISEEFAKSQDGKARDEKGQFVPEKKAKTVSEAPAPPVDVGGKGTPLADEVESAVERDDTAAYMAAKNRRDLASRKR